MNQTQVDHANVKIAPPVLLLIHIFAAFLINWFLPLPFAFPSILVWIGYVLVIIGFGLPFSAANQFMKAHTTLDPHSSVSQIVTRGPYRFSRNPIYLGFVCFLIGITLIFRTYWGLILSPLFIVLLNMLVIKYEEAYLEKKFGEVYTSYKSRVRRWL
ncbi:MAG TPA: isoprenylcysteine carboxylmethyltransferase family protein [Anaerolineales bacterium]|nr:isoprenylcysteine carboxylmethyltransferase family protein [Anaerolineales bacterium]